MERFGHFVEQLRRYSTQVCIYDECTSYKYSELLEEIERWERRLNRLKVEPGAVIGLHADYSVGAIAALFALFARRAIAALVPRDRDVSRYVADARASGVLKMTTRGSYEWLPIESPARHPLIEALRAEGDGGIVIFTSGSTGSPKAALHSTERFLYKFRKPGRRLRTLAFLLFDHVAGLDTLLYTLGNGGSLVLTRQRDPNSILDLIESRMVEVLPASPSFLRLLRASGHVREHHHANLKVITYGADPMDSSTLAWLNAQFPNVQIIQKYGTTETGSPRTISRGNNSLWLRLRSDAVETKVIDGVLWVRSEGAMRGYLNAPSPINDEGWYCTGDLVDVDGEWIRVSGRTVDTINVGGEKVAPAEVERSILELDFVCDVVVSGEPHALMGQIVSARVTLVSAVTDMKEAANRIRQHCRQRLLSYKVPVKIRFNSEQLATPRQKVHRR